MNKQYMAIDQYGNTFHSLQHPRKELMQRIGINHTSKMFVEDKNGVAQHVGYVIGNHWFTVYQVLPFKG